MPYKKEYLTGVALVMVLILNIIDAFYTLYWFKFGIEEGNPLLSYLASRSEFFFFFSKITTVLLGCLFLWSQRHRKSTQYGSFLILLYYNIVVFYHLQAFVSFTLSGKILLAFL